MITKLVIFGITGDLSRRKLLPVLHKMAHSGSLSDIEIIGVSRREVDVSQLVVESVGDDLLAGRIQMLSMDLAEVNDYKKLKDTLKLGPDSQALMYLSVPPGAAAQIADLLGEAGLNTDNVKLLFEKPFGFDLESAKDFIGRTGKYFNEGQIYRIDHYMAKEVARSLIDFRHENHADKDWNNKTIKSIDIQAIESIGIEGRAEFYEQTGALRDVLQGHLMQLLALTLADIDSDFNIDDLPRLRLEALKSVQPADPRLAVRAKYQGYDEEADNIGSTTETFVSAVLKSDSPKWNGVDIRLITGKAMDRKATTITITNKDDSVELFEEGGVYGSRYSDAYEHVLIEAIKGNKAIFTTSDEVIRSWEILAPIQQSWEMMDGEPDTYVRGSSSEEILSGK